MIKHEAIEKLIACPSSDIDMIVDCLKSFETYHKAVYELEITRRLLASTMESSEYRERVQSLDRTRTMQHDSLIINVKVLNRMAEKNGLPLIYDGAVSEERPYRRELANAVFEYSEAL